MINEKPPIGANPYWYTYEKRIQELSEAIARYSQYNRNDSKHIDVIKGWATEIVMCCDIYIKMKEFETLRKWINS
jgi:hypothetical protein